MTKKTRKIVDKKNKKINTKKTKTGDFFVKKIYKITPVKQKKRTRTSGHR